MKELDLKLSLDEVNVILKALGTLPFNQVNNLIPKITGQAQPQLIELEKKD